MKRVICIAVLALVIAGCASPEGSGSNSSTPTDPTTTTSTTTTLPSAPTLVFTVETNGGCMMMGPNCAGYRFLSDGTVELYRTHAESNDAELVATIDAVLVSAVVEQLASTDLIELRSMLPEGECRGCYDGIDTTYIYELNGQRVSFDSADVELLTAIPLFAATQDALTAAAQALPQLEIQER